MELTRLRIVATADRGDHTFSGVMFSIECKADVPVQRMELRAFFVRGHLGSITVWVTPGSWRGRHENQELWSLVYSGVLDPSPHEHVRLGLISPIVLKPGDTVGL